MPDGIAIVAAAPEHDRGAYEVALEADADIPSGEPIVSGPFEQWRDRHFGPLTIRELSFVALEDERVVGYALLAPAHGGHRRALDDRRRAQLPRARHRARAQGDADRGGEGGGLAQLRTQNDLGNAPMRRVNEKLGYVRKFEWVHLGGPLLEG